MDDLSSSSSLGKSLPNIPVFVFPNSLIFSAAQHREHLKQILTIYNPYDFSIKFRVLSTNPTFYTVIDPEGSIKSKNCVDLIIKLSSNNLPSAKPQKSPSDSNSLEDKFRIQIYNYHSKELLGKRDVQSTIYFNGSDFYLSQQLQNQQQNPLHQSTFNYETGGVDYDKRSTSASFQNCYQDERSRNSMVMRLDSQQPIQSYHPNYIAIATALICIIGLLLPNDQNNSQQPPPPTSTVSSNGNFWSNLTIPSIYLTNNQKLLLSYTLGLVTMVLFRP